MDMLWNIIQILVIVIVLISTYKLILAINALEELIARFVEINTTFYKNQNHMMTKLNDINSDYKKIAATVNTLKRVSTKLNNITNK